MSKEFSLDPRLSKDCINIRETSNGFVLLMNNSYYSWFIIVPKLDVIEWFQARNEEQNRIMVEVNVLSKWIKESLGADKINIATIGNIVSQLHIHVVGRKRGDPEWPGVVWGTGESKPYTESELKFIKSRFDSEIEFIK